MKHCHDKEERRGAPGWFDPFEDEGDTSEWTAEQLDQAQLAVGGTIVRAAMGTLTRAGRPTPRGRARRQVTLRLNLDVLERFRADGPRWQWRINEALRPVVRLG